VPSGGMAFRFSLPIEQAPTAAAEVPGVGDGLTRDHPDR
jgi:hypothetical protein